MVAQSTEPVAVAMLIADLIDLEKVPHTPSRALLARTIETLADLEKERDQARALLREGAESAVYDAIIGCSHPNHEKARSIRNLFYDWRKRTAAHFGERWPPNTAVPETKE